MSAIRGFRGEYAFLSNFDEHPVLFDGTIYPTAEHAFQAAKTVDASEREIVRAAQTPSAAKQCGRRVTLRADWEQTKLDVMRHVLRAKFADPDLRRRLLATGEAELVEANNWRDYYWGVCGGKGQNWLGRLLMELRDELRLEVVEKQ